MSDVKRFNFYTQGWPVDDPDGDCVAYDDYAKLEAEAQALREQVAALRARVVVLPEIAAWAWIAKLDGEDWDAGVTIGAEKPNLQAPVEGVTYDYAPLIGLKPLARLNGKAVSEGLLRRILERLRKAQIFDLSSELERTLLGEGKELGDA